MHYNLFAKPWYYDGVQYADLFWYYAKDSGYHHELCCIKHNYTDEQRKADTACMKRLVERGAMIGNSTENFRMVFNSGREQRL